MMYVFHVDTGTMMTFDMNLALGSVDQLKESIERICKIPVEKQVLLVSGGECLDPSARVCSYSAGTDTNPIYLFSKSALENAKPPSPNFDYGSDFDMKGQVDSCLALPATYHTVVARAQLAQQFCELARDHTRVCEELVHDQHLQQQGWAAAVANLEDITSAFKSKSEMFEQSYRQHLEGREENLNMLKNFSKDLEILSKIPILPPLMENALSFSTSQRARKSENSMKANSLEEDECKGDKVSGMTLLMWISAADDQSTLEQMAEQAQRGLEQLDEEVLQSLLAEVTQALDASNTNGMKEIKGLEERLFGLEQLMVETKKIVQEQSDLAHALAQNQNRAGILNDDSILPDLCASHRRQLVLMWQNQHKLCDIRRRCFKAKEELSINLYHRLGWVMYVENLIMNVTNKLMIYHENLKRLRRYVEITRQVQKAPQVYVSAVSEVVRRKNYSQAFLTWASDVSCRLMAVYNEEFEKRREFQSQFEGHFLQSLFPGFEDSPPPFATQAPPPFDVNLPNLTVRDMELLKEYLPELEMNISVTKLSAIAQMLLTKSISETKSSDSKENVPVEDRLVAAVTEAGLSSKLDETLLQEGERVAKVAKDDRDFESETDTEEFEKVCQSPVDTGVPPESKFEVGPLKDMNLCTFPSHPKPHPNQEFVTTDFYLDESMPSTYSASSEGVSHSQVAQFQEALESSKSEVELLRYHLTTASKLANQTASHLKAELNEMKNNSVSDRESILHLVKDIQNHVSSITKGYADEIESLHRKLDEIVSSGKRETEALEQVVRSKEELLRVVTEDMNKIRSILEDTENEKQGLSESLSTSQQLCQELQLKLEDAVQERMKVVQDISGKLAADYQIKIASLEEELTKAKEETRKRVEEERVRSSHEISEKEEAITEMKRNMELEHQQRLEDLKQKMIEEAEAEKQKAVKEISEKLAEDYKIEIDNLRSRFKLMSAANMEKSLSEASLEKIERLDFIELSNHEAIVLQLKEDAAAKREQAVKEAVEEEREKCKLKLEEELKLGKARMKEEKQIWLTEAVNRATVEKNTQIENLMKRQESLLTECQRLRDTVKLLTDGEQFRPRSSPGAGTLDPLLERIRTLESEKVALSVELEKEKRKEADGNVMTKSTPAVSVMYREVGTSPERSNRISKDRSARPAAHDGKISIRSCNDGDEVLIMWNEQLSYYMILQEKSEIYLLNENCWESLGLDSESPRKVLCTGQVVKKEYCCAKKEVNKYGIPKGKTFYRVLVKPILWEEKSFFKFRQDSHTRSPLSDRKSFPVQSESTKLIASGATCERLSLQDSTGGATSATAFGDAERKGDRRNTEAKTDQSNPEGKSDQKDLSTSS